MKVLNVGKIQYKNNNNKPLNKTQKLSCDFKTPNFQTYPKNYYLPNFTSKKDYNFAEAKTLSEAKNFGASLGVIQYSGCNQDEYLDVINFINSGLADAKNKIGGKLKIPSYIHFCDLGTSQMALRHINGGVLCVNNKIYFPENIDNEIYRMIEELEQDEIILSNDEKYYINPKLSCVGLDEFFESINQMLFRDYKNLDFEGKVNLYNKIRCIYERTSNLNRYPQELIIKMLQAGCWGEFDQKELENFEKKLLNTKQSHTFSELFKFLKTQGDVVFGFDLHPYKHKTLFHELGHMQNKKICTLPVASQFNCLVPYTDEMLKWLDNKENMKTAFEISSYTCSGIPEFIAECYSWLLEGRELPQNAQELYKKLGGPKVIFSGNF